MADLRKRVAENVAGEFFVDSTCIDCDQCREIAPGFFGDASENGGQACVRRQPAGGADRLIALQALVSCPVGAIGTRRAAADGKAELAAAAGSFPLDINGAGRSGAANASAEDDGIYFCGYASRASYGASSYLIVRPEGNVLVDSPRFAGPLVRRIEALGGVRWMFLSHVDDVADHARFRAHFAYSGCERILHERELTALTGRRASRDGIEIVITGDADTALASDLTIIPTPGHTAGHQSLLAGNKYLFTGDHLWWSRALGRLNASRTYCWHSWPQQLDSLPRLLSHSFEWVLPGHGQRHHAPNAAAMRASLHALLTALK